MIPWYDDPTIILTKLDSIDSLWELFKARKKAGYDKGERLNEWCILGRWYLDTCGNSMRIIEGIDTKERSLFSVNAWDTVCSVLQDERRSITSTADPELPQPNSICQECKKGWDINQIDDVYTYYSSGKLEYWHKECWTTFKTRSQKEQFNNICKEAGFSEFGLEEIPNEYCPCENCRPWFFIWTPKGKIKIGWRKSVINIDWSEFMIKAEPDFQSENVTKGFDYIHAHGQKKAVEYLKNIRLCSN